MAKYPMIFSASTSATEGISSAWTALTADGRELVCSVPKEFEGPNTGFSPEDLYLQALLNCYIATLKVIAQNSKLRFSAITGTGSLKLDHDPADATPQMKEATLSFSVTGTEAPDRFRRLMERVSKQCMVLNSVKTALHFEFEVS